MKIKSFALAGLLALSMSLSPVRGQDKKEEVKVADAEYNIGFCGANTFDETHLVIKTVDGKQTLVMAQDYNGEEVEVDPTPIVFSTTKVEKDADGNIVFLATGNYKDVDDGTEYAFELAGKTYKDKVIVAMTANGKLSALLYGRAGKLDDIKSPAQDDYNFCVALHEVDSLDLLKPALDKWLHADDVPAPQGNTQK